MNTFSIVAEPSRRRILDALVTGPRPVGELVEELGMSQPVVSKHLRILRDADVVTVTPSGQRRLYAVNPAPLKEIHTWLEPYRRFWDGKLDDLEAHLAAEKNND